MDNVLISAGEVIEVQLTSETVVVEALRTRPDGERRRTRSVTEGRISNRMRVFVREDNGHEDDYDFEGASIGVRDGHRVAAVRGKISGAKEPINLMLANFSTDERDIFENNLFRFLYKKPFFGPLWKAFGLALILFGILYVSTLVSDNEGAMSPAVVAGFFAFLALPVFWWLCGLWDKYTGRARYKKMRARFIADVEGRLRAHSHATRAA